MCWWKSPFESYAKFLKVNHMRSSAEFNTVHRGYTPTVKFLHANRREGCTTWAMNEAVKNGHLEVVKFLQNLKLPCAAEAKRGKANDP